MRLKARVWKENAYWYARYVKSVSDAEYIVSTYYFKYWKNAITYALTGKVT